MNQFTLWAAAGVVMVAVGLTIGWLDGRRACRAGHHQVAYDFGQWRCVRCPHTTASGCTCAGCRAKAAA